MRQSAEVRVAILELDDLAEKVLAEDEEADPWEALDSKVLDWIEGQLRRCRQDFPYAAGNYFHIVEKGGKESLLDLWEAQELLWAVVQWMWKHGRPAWIIIDKARQLGFSTLVQGLIAWMCMYFKNRTALIVADDPDQSEWLFSKMLYLYDHMPWWMRPASSSRKYEDGIIFDNPDVQMRRRFPGLNSRIIVNSANKLSSVGQGKTLAGIHASEVSSWRPSWRASEIIDEDLRPAAVDKPGNFFIMESTPKGVDNFWYDCWEAYYKEGPKAMFYPFFAPAFFESSRRIVPPDGFLANEEEVQMREKYATEWRRCVQCGTPVPTAWSGILDDNAPCIKCSVRHSEPIILDDRQLYWYRVNLEEARKKDKGKRGRKYVKKFYQEMSVTPEQGFQVSGEEQFPEAAMHWVESTTCPPRFIGHYDAAVRFHYNDRGDEGQALPCKICKEDHSDDPLSVWELPVPGAKYIAGVDVAEGSEEGDWSVIHLIKIGYGFEDKGGQCDTQVLEYRAQVDGEELARQCYMIGKAYNWAVMAIEVNKSGELVQHILKNQMRYPQGQIFRWKHYDNAGPIISRKDGWVTNPRTRAMIVSKGISALKKRYWKIQSITMLQEMRTFIKDEDEASARAARGKFDDTVMAGLICFFAAHDVDTNPLTSRIDIPGFEPWKPDPRTLVWTARCHCGKTWDASDLEHTICPECGKKPMSASKKEYNDERGDPVATSLASLVESKPDFPLRADPMNFDML